jgi:hypothetical protein
MGSGRTARTRRDEARHKYMMEKEMREASDSTSVARAKRLRRVLAGAVALSLAGAVYILARPVNAQQVAPWNAVVMGYTVVMLMAVAFLVLCGAQLAFAALAREYRTMRRRLLRSAVATGILIAVVVITDIVLSFLPAFKTENADPAVQLLKIGNFEEDKVLGFRLKPNQELYRHFDPTRDTIIVMDGQLAEVLPTGEEKFEEYLNIDSDGFRNESVPEQAEIVAVGDSFTFGESVKREDSWAVILKKQRGVSLYNTGVSGYCPPQELIALREYGLTKKPKVVLWEFFAGGDLLESERFYDFQQHDESFFGSLQARQNPFPYNRPLIKLLVSLVKGSQAKNAPIPYPGPERVAAGGVEKPIIFDRWTFNLQARSREQTEKSLGWRVTCESLKEGKRLCDEARARMVFIYVPDKLAVYSKYVLDKFDKEKMLEFARSALTDLPDVTPDEFIEDLRRNLNNQRDLLRDFCKANGIEFIDMQEPLQKCLDGGTWPYYCYDTHLNAAGNRVAAETIASYLEAHP